MAASTELKILSIELISNTLSKEIKLEEQHYESLNFFRPDDDVTSMKTFRKGKAKSIAQNIIDREADFDRHAIQAVKLMVTGKSCDMEPFEEELKVIESLKGWKTELATEFDTKAQTIYAQIDYPFEKNTVFEIKVEGPITLGSLLFAYTHAYQKKYELNEGKQRPIKGLLNECTEGRFGFCAHGIGDLVYNGTMSIYVDTDYIAVNFDVDS